MGSISESLFTQANIAVRAARTGVNMQKKRKSVDASYLRKYNQRLILDAVYARSTTSRVALSKALGLSKPAISDNLSDLLKVGVIEEIGEGTPTEKGGRKPSLLQFNKNLKIIVAIDLNYIDPVIVLGNLQNEVLSEKAIHIPKDTPYDQRFTMIENCIDSLLKATDLPPAHLFCIAISSPGIFDADGNILTQNIGYGRTLWKDSHLKKAWQQKYSADIIIKNDIKAATLGEWTYGAGKGEENLLYVSCGAGMGSGIILNNSLFEGRHYNAGEIYYYLDMSQPDYAGPLEDRICIKPLIENVRADVQRGVHTCLRDCEDQISFSDIVLAYQAKDSYICRKVDFICDELCTLIYNLGNFLALDKVIFGGEYTVFGETLQARFQERFQTRIKFSTSIQFAALGKYSGIHGMLYMARDAYFTSICS
jgi:predicted NBD/HSP70 family sugar kinase